MSNSTVDSGYGESHSLGNGSPGQSDSPTIMQMNGILLKKPFGHQSTKWSRRFFVLKEGFLLYYAESEKKAFETKKYFNIHPKGVIPLGYCTIEDVAIPGMQFCININHPDFKAPICVATDDEESRKMWIRAMDKATKVTLENSELGETMIKSLQEQSLQLARERQEYVDKFINEAEELGAERELREALEEFNQELEEENARIETLVSELKTAHNEVKKELQQAIESSKQLESERADMANKTQELKANLEQLSNERVAIIQKLQDHEAKAELPAEQNAELARQLAEIEQKAKTLESDKENIRLRLEENERKSLDILREREMISKEAEELKYEIQNLAIEKKMAEKELKEETVARAQLQRELDECKAALRRLELKALSNSLDKRTAAAAALSIAPNTVPTPRTSQSDSDDGDEQILKDVKSLREFFENCAKENLRDTDRPSLRKVQASTKLTASESFNGVQNGGASSVRTLLRGSRIHQRRANTARCKSMVLNDSDAGPVVIPDPSYRWSVMMSRQKRSMSLSGRGRKAAARMCAE